MEQSESKCCGVNEQSEQFEGTNGACERRRGACERMNGACDRTAHFRGGFLLVETWFCQLSTTMIWMKDCLQACLLAVLERERNYLWLFGGDGKS